MKIESGKSDENLQKKKRAGKTSSFSTLCIFPVFPPKPGLKANQIESDFMIALKRMGTKLFELHFYICTVINNVYYGFIFRSFYVVLYAQSISSIIFL